MCGWRCATPIFTTAKRIAAAVNDFLGVKTAEPIDPSTVQLSIPPEFKGNVVAFLTEIEQLQVDPDLAARIVIDERSGIIVYGPRCPRRHRRGRPGQSHGFDFRKARKSASPIRCRADEPW